MPFDLAASARNEMLSRGFHPDFPPQTAELIAATRSHPPSLANGVRDLRDLLWSSIDNATSRDLDQIEVAERTADGIRVLIGIADVDAAVPIGSPLDQHARSEATTVYTPVKTFPMLPLELSTDLTSLNEAADRLALVIEMLIANDGAVTKSDVSRALVRNHAQLTYESTGPWIERSAPPPKIAANLDLQAQLQLQDEAARALRDERHRRGALVFDRAEANPIVANGKVTGIAAQPDNRASNLIEQFMIAANEAIANWLLARGIPALQRVVSSPERWPRIVDLAAQHGATLPAQPDPVALSTFLRDQQAKDPARYPDLSLAVIKLLGPGSYEVVKPGHAGSGHFALASHDYTHSTAPNRRFADLATQRLLKAALLNRPSPYPDDDLNSIAQNCTAREDAARKVARAMNKRAVALAYHDRIGQTFDAVVTGVKPNATFVRVLNPPIEGMLARGSRGLDVGDRLRVALVSTDVERGYVDFARL